MPDQSSAATEHAILQEITAPLNHLPDDPLALVEAEFPTSLRGYDRDAVDDYVEHTRQLVSELQATRSPEAAVRRALERVGDQISGILQRAHETAEQITAQSRAEAEDRLQIARREAEQVTSAAEQRVRELDAETDRIWLERQRIVADADDLSTRLKDLAELAGRRFETDEQAAAADAGAQELPATAPEESMLAGTPTEAGAADGPYDRAEEATPPLGEDETAPLREDETVPLAQDETVPLVQDETVPLREDETVPQVQDETVPRPEEDRTAAGAQDAPVAPGAQDAPVAPGPDAPLAPGPDAPGTIEDSAAVIPPSSQAAHRRRER
ncbi:MAG: DivIVA domain-containing protein [Solirubrobacterales bacterium]|nr:DivIVA domain-containing protein [Solirubrobacterales bacterium]